MRMPRSLAWGAGTAVFAVGAWFVPLDALLIQYVKQMATEAKHHAVDVYTSLDESIQGIQLEEMLKDGAKVTDIYNAGTKVMDICNSAGTKVMDIYNGAGNKVMEIYNAGNKVVVIYSACTKAIDVYEAHAKAVETLGRCVAKSFGKSMQGFPSPKYIIPLALTMFLLFEALVIWVVLRAFLRVARRAIMRLVDTA